MISPDRVVLEQKVYGEPLGITAVYLGTYIRLNSDRQPEVLPVAVKEIQIMKPEHKDTLMQEIVVQSKLEECPYICKIHGYYILSDKLYIVSEQLYRDLDRDMRERGQCYSEFELLSMLWEVTTALEFAKSKVSLRQNIAHRDVKPQNILLARVGAMDVKMVDFGSGSIVDGKVEKLIGTSLFMSPEQVPDFEQFRQTHVLPPILYDHFKSDVYSLGVTFLQLALMQPPVNLITGNRSAACYNYLNQVAQSYPFLTQILSQMLQDDPEQRPNFDYLLGWIPSYQQPAAIPDGSEDYQTYSVTMVPQSLVDLKLSQDYSGIQFESCFTWKLDSQKQKDYLDWLGDSEVKIADKLNFLFSGTVNRLSFSVLISRQCSQCPAWMYIHDSTECGCVEEPYCSACAPKYVNCICKQHRCHLFRFPVAENSAQYSPIKHSGRNQIGSNVNLKRPFNEKQDYTPVLLKPPSVTLSLEKFPKPGQGKVKISAAKPGLPGPGTPTQAFQQTAVSSPYAGGQNSQQLPVQSMAPGQVGKPGVPAQGKSGLGYPQMQAKPGPAQPAVSPGRSPAMIEPQKSGTYVIRSVSLNVVSASEENTEPPVEIQISRITYQGQQLIASQLKPQMWLQWYQGGVFDLLTAPMQSARRALEEEYKAPPPQVPQVIEKPSNILAVTQFDSVFPGGGGQWLSELKDFVINKYHGIYYLRGSSQATSVAAYLLQCVLLEQVCVIYQNDPKNPSIKGNPSIQRKQFPRCIAAAFRMPDSSDPYSPTLKSSEFETYYQIPITTIEMMISDYLNMSPQKLNFPALANMVKVCITVLSPNGHSFAKTTYFPDGALDEEWQHMTLIGVPPYPVLMKKKMFSILDAVKAHITVDIDIKPYILKKKKFEPPKIDQSLNAMKKLSTLNSGVKGVTGSLLKFSQALLSRFETLLQDGSLDESFCSSDVGKSLMELKANLEESVSLPFSKEAAIQGPLQEVRQLLSGRVSSLFGTQCDWCAYEHVETYRDIVLACRHNLCKRHINLLIQEAQAGGQIVVSPTSDQTSLFCPFCQKGITKSALEAYDTLAVKRLMKLS